MRLRRLEICRFRKLAGPVVIDGLGDGITVIGGDNEEGKSTVLAALKAALFEVHGVGGAVREQMAPHEGGLPEVQVELEVNGERYRLQKAFRKGGVALDTPRGRLVGDAAEQALIELLHFERRTAREAKPQNLGLQAIFWVDQGTSFAGFEALEAGRDRLSAAIEAETGALAAGDRGRRLLVSVTRSARELWTPTWKETGALAEAGRRVEALSTTLGELRSRRQVYDARIDRLARLRDERRRAIGLDELGRSRAALVDARRAVGEIEALEVELDRVDAEVRLCQSQWRRLDEQARHRSEAGRAIELMEATVDSAGQALLVARESAERAALSLRRAVDDETSCVRRLAELERQHGQALGQRRIGELSRLLDRLRADHAAALEAESLVTRLTAELASDPTTAERVAAVVEAQSICRVAVAELQAVATRLDFAPRGGAGVKVGGVPHPPGRPLHVSEKAEIELDGFGLLMVQPGGGDVERRRASLARAQAGLEAALAAAGASDPSDARSRLDARQRLDRGLVEARARLDAVLTGHGRTRLAQLSEDLALAEAELAALTARFTPPDPESDLGRILDGLEAELRRARGGREEAAEAQQRIAGTAAAARAEAARCEARSAELLEQLDSRRRALSEELLRCPDERMRAELEAAEQARAEAERRLAVTQRRLTVSDPSLARDRAAQAERKVAAIEAEAQRLEREIRDVEIELRSSEAQALGERIAELEGELARAEAERQRLATTARAWRLLHKELAASLTAARDALLVPVRERIGPYLQRLFPDAEVVLDPETLALDRLRRGGIDEGFGQLSLGTREQLAIVVRLALAELLQEKEGHSPCLVLDDALVYADETRLDIMKTILQQAARDLQILILTCRPRDYRGLDARFLRLENCRR